MDKNVFQKTYDSIDNLINISLEWQEKHSKIKKIIGQKSFVKEFCTVRYSGPRQSGHSTAISKLSHKYNSWVLVFRFDAIERIKDLGFQGEVFTFQTFDENIRGLKLPTVIFVDCAYFFPKKALDSLTNNISQLYENKLCLVLIQ